MPDHLRTVCIKYSIYFTIKENQTLIPILMKGHSVMPHTQKL